MIATLSIAVGLALIMLFIRINRHRENGRCARNFCGLFLPFNNFELEIFGHFDPSATLLMLNHQSAADIIFLEGLHPQNICWIAKKQLGEIPFYGYALRGPEMILIDREDKASLVYMMREAKKKLEQKRPLVIFPEGTRCKDETRFLKFKSGAKILAEKLKLKVQPVVLIHSSRVYNSSPIESRGNKARIVILEAFEPNTPDWYERLEHQMYAVYQRHFQELQDS
ncbi:lysophospholipid acyltransferase family protein [Helicobacter enhydrae]|nr:lysophospholipid acyltransferase family protein [Helicobacter enhydrae]